MYSRHASYLPCSCLWEGLGFRQSALWCSWTLVPCWFCTEWMQTIPNSTTLHCILACRSLAFSLSRRSSPAKVPKNTSHRFNFSLFKRFRNISQHSLASCSSHGFHKAYWVKRLCFLRESHLSSVRKPHWKLRHCLQNIPSPIPFLLDFSSVVCYKLLIVLMKCLILSYNWLLFSRIIS